MNNKHMTYQALRNYFVTRFGEELASCPATLDGELAYWSDLPNTIRRAIKLIDTEFDKLGARNIKASTEAIRSKELLRIIYHDIHDESNWNKQPKAIF